MESLQQQFDSENLEIQDLSAESSQETKSERVGGIRKYAKMAIIGAIGAAMAACGAEAKDSQNIDDSNASSEESAEVIQKVPVMDLSRPTKQEQLAYFEVGLFYGTEEPYEFVVTSLDDPTDQVSLTSEVKQVQTIRGKFQNLAPTGFKVEAFDMEGNPVPIDGSRREGTIFGPDVFDGEPFNELD